MSTLDIPAMRLLDRDSRGELNRVLVAAQRASGKSYVQVYNDYAKAAGDMGGTVGAVVAGLGADTATVGRELRVLEAAELAQRALHSKAAELMTLEAEAAASPARDPGSLTAPEAEVSRFARANRVTSEYAGPEGLDKFRRDNRQMALAGRDLVAQLEAPVMQQRAAAIVERHGQTLARVANGDGDPDTRIRALSQAAGDGIKLLEQEIGGDTTQLGGTFTVRHHGPLMMLEAPTGRPADPQARSRRALELMASRGEQSADAYLRALRQAERGQ